MTRQGVWVEAVSTKIKVDEPFTIRLDGSTSVCAGFQYSDPSGGADNYEWKVGTEYAFGGNTYRGVKGNNDYEVMVHTTKSGSVCVADTKFTVKVGKTRL